jgi:hypothetical protein
MKPMTASTASQRVRNQIARQDPGRFIVAYRETSMKVANITAAAINQGLAAGFHGCSV